MQYRSVPKTGEQLSALGYGGMRFPTLSNGKIDEEAATRQLRMAIDAGVNYVDTAYPYHGGASESFIGQALAGGYREKVFLATKLPQWLVRNREDMDRYLDLQRQRLETDVIDYYLIHTLQGASWERVRDLGVLDFLDAAKASGKIRNAGFSFHGDITAFKEIVDAYDWEFCQIQYNYLDEHYQAGTEGLRYAAGKGLAVIIMEPLRGGMLARQVPAEGSVLLDAAPEQRSPAEWGLRWIWNHPEVTVVLSGMNDDAHIEENIKTAETALPGSLSAVEIAVVEGLGDAFRARMKVGCTGCGYCVPCPAGVNIPDCFALYNEYHLTGDRHTSAGRYLAHLGGVLGDPGYASLCKNCGKCVRVCPQGLPVPELLGEVKETFEGKTMWIKRPVMIGGLRVLRIISALRSGRQGGRS
jgi:predicted aldo/keto reductase-like oxidoreductase